MLEGLLEEIAGRSFGLLSFSAIERWPHLLLPFQVEDPPSTRAAFDLASVLKATLKY